MVSHRNLGIQVNGVNGDDGERLTFLGMLPALRVFRWFGWGCSKSTEPSDFDLVCTAAMVGGNHRYDPILRILTPGSRRINPGL
jgi:hypothetical protein